MCIVVRIKMPVVSRKFAFNNCSDFVLPFKSLSLSINELQNVEPASRVQPLLAIAHQSQLCLVEHPDHDGFQEVVAGTNCNAGLGKALPHFNRFLLVHMPAQNVIPLTQLSQCAHLMPQLGLIPEHIALSTQDATKIVFRWYTLFFILLEAIGAAEIKLFIRHEVLIELDWHEA